LNYNTIVAAVGGRECIQQYLL